MKNLLRLIVCISLFCCLAMPVVSQVNEPIHELRIYEIFKNNKEAFHERFRDHAARIMKTYGFKIVAIWESEQPNRTEFVYLLEWPDKKTLDDSWAKFKADKEWIEIKKQMAAKHGELVGEIQDRVLYLKDYSPSKSLLVNR